MQSIITFFRMYRQLNEILTKPERKKAVTIAFLSVFSALLETLGVGVILPFILAMLQPEQLLEYKFIANLFDLCNIHSSMQIVFFVGSGVILVYIVKNLFILLFNRYKLVFRNKLERDLSIKMLQAYLNKSYSFFLNSNSSEIMRGISGDNSAVATVVDNYSILFNEGLTCIMLGIMLVLLNPIMAIGILVLAGGISAVMVVLIKKRISVCSKLAREAFGDRYRYSYESINGIKEIDVMKRQDKFLAKFARAATTAADNNTKYLWIAMLPSRITETFFITGMVLIVVLAYRMSKDVSLIAAQLSALGVAAIRILPSITNISNAMSSLVFQRPALESAYENLVVNNIRSSYEEKMLERRADTDVAMFRDKISVEGITWRYNEGLPNVLENLSLEVKKGEAIGLVGESGAGKTTLADIILGLFRPQEGDVTVDGKSIFDKEVVWHKMVGYVPQNVFLIDASIRNNILFGIDEKDADEERINKAIEQAQLTDFVKKQTDGLDTILGERGVKISGGQRQRIAIARALYYNPEILVLDEATSALDNDTEAAVIDAINALQGEKTLIIVAHRLTTI